MVQESITIRISNGLETRPIAMLVQVASQFESSIYLEKGTKKVNAKSIMGMMTLGLDNGETVLVKTSGADEEGALSAIRDFLSRDTAL